MCEFAYLHILIHQTILINRKFYISLNRTYQILWNLIKYHSKLGELISDHFYLRIQVTSRSIRSFSSLNWEIQRDNEIKSKRAQFSPCCKLDWISEIWIDWKEKRRDQRVFFHSKICTIERGVEAIDEKRKTLERKISYGSPHRWMAEIIS